MKIVQYLLFSLFLSFGIISIQNTHAQEAANSLISSSTPSNTPVFLNIPDTTTQPILNKLIKQLGNINKSLQSLQHSEDFTQFKNLLNQARSISTSADAIVTDLTPRLKGYNQALKLLDNVIQNTGSDKNKDDIKNLNDRQKSFIQNRNDLSAKIQQATIISLEANSQVAQIQQALSKIQQVQLFTRISSPLGYNFWHEIAIHYDDDSSRINKLYSDFGSLFTKTWQDSWGSRLTMLTGFLGAILLIFILRPLIEKGLVQFTEKFIPPTRLRRSLMTLCSAIIASFTAGLSATLILVTINNHNTISPQAYAFAQNIIHQLYFCGFIFGLYRGFLAVKNPQWRLLPIGDEVAHSINILPNIYMAIILLLGIVRYINNVSGVSIIAQQLCNGFFACVASILFLSIPIKLREVGQKRIKLHSAQNNQSPDITLLVVAIGLPLFCIISIVAILTGYIHLGYSMCVWLNWVILVFSTLSLLRILLNDITNLIFDPDRWLGKKIQLLGIKPQSMEQLSTIITGVITLTTVILTIVSIISPGNFDLVVFIQHLTTTLTNQKIGNFTFSFSTIAEAILVFFIGIYCIRIVRNWLNKNFFPKTSLDNATCNSIDTIFNYCCWVVVAIIDLSILGVTTQNITWIVSALSVGIGFGLQAIVQNFVSGLILLAERPVRIGDTVIINGVKGVIMSIKVRATEIRLSDFSTLIVPNSQIITSSVQNATRGRHMGLVSFKLPVITIQQLDQARTLIMKIMEKQKDVLDDPKPYIWVDNITESSLVMTIVCYTNYLANTDAVRNNILSEYLNNISQLSNNKPSSEKGDK